MGQALLKLSEILELASKFYRKRNKYMETLVIARKELTNNLH